ncbi:hypothetical protein QBC46DRAFT_461048 [Diplogelasinospora grovesii]|uniref:Uncharacterized protein n=1 Tax=Diplogelasinospora grovesii TaxID=303347 RepID=A0AAN6S1K9_9PEZI|nr:hypothetical protein QBC46DRAFT_461048 [Diplogelasinospora grovesii]
MAVSRRKLRTALSFLLRPLLAALLFTFTLRFLFSPPSNSFTKALVIASTSDLPPSSTSWLKNVPRAWTVYSYITDAPTSPALSVPVNKGNEAMVYLTYITTHYDSLPDVIFFHHAHSKGWHQELDSLTEVKRLRAEYVSKVGYASARCLSACENIIPLAEFSVDPKELHLVGRDVQIATLLDEFLDRSIGERVPKKIAAPCCAQFAASRDAIRRRPKEWWVRLRQWLIDTPLDSQTAGRLVEWTWHIWLGQPAEYCPDYKECKCHVFGMGECKEVWKKEGSM